jgi:hypothetical protein
MKNSKTYQKLCGLGKSRILAVVSASLLFCVIIFISAILTTFVTNSSFVFIALMTAFVSAIIFFINTLKLQDVLLDDWEKVPVYIHWSIIIGAIISLVLITKFYVRTKSTRATPQEN